MKATLFLSLFVLCFSTLHAQDKAKEKEAIRQEFQAINHDSSLKTITLNNDEFIPEGTDRGCYLTGFFKSGQLQKMVSWVGVSNANYVTEYYFKNNQLIFVYEQYSSLVYDEKGDSLRFDTLERTFEGRYYFVGNKLIDQVTMGHNSNEYETRAPERFLLDEATENKRLLAKRERGGK